MTLYEYLNQMNEENCFEALMRCCGSRKWAKEMVDKRPYLSDSNVHEKAISIWSNLEKCDYLEAFSHHPQIGADVSSLRKKFKTTASWSASEQSGVSQAKDSTLHLLAKGNKDYIDKFGYIFIVCASGKSASEMLALLLDRLPSTPEEEILIAAGEQAKITALRLEKLIS